MKRIDAVLQRGFMTRRGWRGRWLTVYHHSYNGAREKSERFHVHPWRWAISIIYRGAFTDHLKKRRTSAEWRNWNRLHGGGRCGPGKRGYRPEPGKYTREKYIVRRRAPSISRLSESPAASAD